MRRVLKEKRLIVVCCLVFLFLMGSSMTAFATEGEVREAEGDAGITFIAEDEEPEPPGAPGPPEEPGPPGPGGGGPGGRWPNLPQTGSQGNLPLQSAGITLIIGAAFCLVAAAKPKRK